MSELREACEICQLYSPSGCARLSKEPCIREALQLISETATNGDIYDVLFDRVGSFKDSSFLTCEYTEDSWKSLKKNTFSKTWWNTKYAGYKEGYKGE